MDLEEKIERMNKAAGAIALTTRTLNKEASSLNGVAAVIPADAPFPISHFKGEKVILHNVSYDPAAKCISAVVTLPYRENEVNYAQGHDLIVFLNEKWFK